MDLCNINEIKALLARHGFRFSKSMGQNFLIDPEVPRRIAESSGAEDTMSALLPRCIAVSAAEMPAGPPPIITMSVISGITPSRDYIAGISCCKQKKMRV